MKLSSLESVVKRNTLSVDVKELSTVCIVVNSLSSQDEDYEVNLLVVEIVGLKCSHPIATFRESLSLAKEKMRSIHRQGFLGEV